MRISIRRNSFAESSLFTDAPNLKLIYRWSKVDPMKKIIYREFVNLILRGPQTTEITSSFPLTKKLCKEHTFNVIPLQAPLCWQHSLGSPCHKHVPRMFTMIFSLPKIILNIHACSGVNAYISYLTARPGTFRVNPAP